jgi:pimeloyl-ACP methyl ester carboxylesterase
VSAQARDPELISVPVEGGELAALHWPADSPGAPIAVLVHGITANAMAWAPVAAALAGEFEVIAPDLRGRARSAGLPGPYGLDRHADDVATLLDTLDVQDAAVVGSSLGGRVALELATLHPGRVRSLVLLCPAFRGVEPTPAAEAFDAEEERLLEAGDVEGATALNVRTWLGPEADASAREALAAMQRNAFEVQLAADAWPEPPRPRRVVVDPEAVGAPTLVVSGGQDMDLFRATAAHLAQGIPGADHLELPWAGHLPALERPEATAQLLLDALGHPVDEGQRVAR